MQCPYCLHPHAHHIGHNTPDAPRFRCNKCKRSYTWRTGTCMHHLKKRDTFLLYMNHMLTHGHVPLKTMTNLFRISHLTAFDWRHKVLSAMHCSPKQFRGLVQLRNTTFEYNRKGARNDAAKKTSAPAHILIAENPFERPQFTLMRIGKLRVADYQKVLDAHCTDETVLVSRTNPVLEHIKKQRKYPLTLFADNDNDFDLTDEHAAKTNSALNELAIKRTRGVSTKYLQRYARWLRPPKHDLLTNRHAWTGFTNLENNFHTQMNQWTEIRWIQSNSRQWISSSFLLSLR